MASATIPGVYASALLAVARERGTAAAVVEAAKQFADALTPDVVRPLEDPRVGKQNAKLTIGAVTANAPKELYDLLQLLIDRNRLESASAILRETIRQYEAEEGIIHINLTVAAPVSDAVRDAIVERIRNHRGTRAVLNLKVEPKLLGGFTSRIGDEYLDASTQRQVNEMRQAMLATPVGESLWSPEP